MSNLVIKNIETEMPTTGTEVFPDERFINMLTLAMSSANSTKYVHATSAGISELAQRLKEAMS